MTQLSQGSSSQSSTYPDFDLGSDEIELLYRPLPDVFTQSTAPNLCGNIKLAVLNPKYQREWDEWWVQTRWRINNKHVKIDWTQSKKPASYWQFYQPVARVKDGHPFIQCIRCHDALTHPHIKNSGTSALIRHLQTRKCSSTGGSRSDHSIAELLRKSSIKTMAAQRIPEYIRQSDIEAQIVRVITALNMSFRSIENPEFLRLIRMLLQASPIQTFNIPSAYLIPDLLSNQAIEGRRIALQRILPGTKISLAVDCWTSPNHKSFLALTGYFIDSGWSYQEILLGFNQIPGRHTGQNLANSIQQTLQDCQIEHSSIISITSDNASNNKTMIQSIHDALRVIDDDTGLQRIIRVPCLAHVIQIACSKLIASIRGSIDKYPETGPPQTLRKLRDIVIYINASPQRREKFHSCQGRKRPLNLVQDVPTRWNSTLKMILRARRLRSTLQEYYKRFPEDMVQLLATEEWKHLDYLIEILYPFMKYTNAIGMTKDTPTIHYVYHFYHQLIGHTDYIEQLLAIKRRQWKIGLRNAVIESRQKLEKYYIQIRDDLDYLYATATILAPQYKLKFFESDDWQVGSGKDRYVDIYEKALNDRFRLYHDIRQNNTETTETDNDTPSTVSCDWQFSTLSDSTIHIPSKRKDSGTLSALLAPSRKRARYSNISSEIEYYLNDVTHFGVDIENYNQVTILDYWRTAERKLPTLAAMARDILPIPAAGVGVERLFNNARDICTYRRHHLRPTTISNLMLLLHSDRSKLRDNLRHSFQSSEEEEESIDEDDQFVYDEEIECVTGLISEDEASDIEDIADDINEDSIGDSVHDGLVERYQGSDDELFTQEAAINVQQDSPQREYVQIEGRGARKVKPTARSQASGLQIRRS